MRLSLKAISEFQDIYFKKYEVELSNDEANKKGLELLEFFKTIYKKVPNKDSEILRFLDPEYRAS